MGSLQMHTEDLSKIRILFLINLLTNRGAGRQLLDVIIKLTSITNVHIFAINTSPGIFTDLKICKNLKCYRFPYKKGRNILIAHSLHERLREGRYHAIITLGTGASLFFGRICALCHRVPIVYSELHTLSNLNKTGNQYFEFPNRILNFLIPRIPGRRNYRFLPVCDTLTSKIKKITNRYPIETLYNGIPIDNIYNLIIHDPSDRIKRILNDIVTHPTIIQIGVLDENKNQLFTLKCVKKLKKTIPRIRYIIVGKGKMMAELKNWVAINNLTEHVIFTKQLDRKDCLHLINRSDVLVLTSHSEALPMVLLEAQGLSVPVVTFDVGGAAEVVNNGSSGYLIESGDDKAFIEKVTKLLLDTSLRKKMGFIGKTRVQSKFTIDIRTERLLSILAKDLLTLGIFQMPKFKA